MKILFEDRKKNTKIREKLVSMKQEKEWILQRMHEMGMQIHQAQEGLTEHIIEAKVNHSTLSSNSSSDRSVGSFEKHTRGIGYKLMLKTSYDGKGLGKHAQSMIGPIMVEEKPKKFGLGYVQSYGKNSTTMKAFETTSKRTFVASLNPQTCQVCFRVECHCLKPMLQQVVYRHATYDEQESYDSYQDNNTDVGIQKKDGTS